MTHLVLRHVWKKTLDHVNKKVTTALCGSDSPADAVDMLNGMKLKDWLLMPCK